MKITLFLRPGKGRNPELPLYVRFRNGSTDIKQVTRLAVNPEYWDDKAHKLKTKMRLPDELRQSFNREQVALEEYISNSYYSCEDKDGIDASWLEAIIKHRPKKSSKPTSILPRTLPPCSMNS